MDEPLASLDRDARADILPRLERLHRAAAIPIVYVSHDPAEIARLADRVLLMQGGKIVGEPVSPAAGLATPGARGSRTALAAADEDRVARLALAALLAGLEPFWSARGGLTSGETIHEDRAAPSRPPSRRDRSPLPHDPHAVLRRVRAFTKGAAIWSARAFSKAGRAVTWAT